MNVENNITNVINFLDYEIEVTKSYKWENKECKNTFPVDQWIPILIDFLYNEKTPGNIEKEYVQFLPRVTRPTHNMYINSLLKKFYFSSTVNFKKIKKFSEEEIENWIIKHINSIINKHYDKAVSKAKKIMDNWKTYILQKENINSLSNEKITKNIFKIVKNYKNRNIEFWEKLDLKKIKRKKYVYKNKKNKNSFKNQNLNSDKREKIGKLGEELFYGVLVNKYGYDKVIHTSNIDKFSSYDFEVNLENNKKLFFEVKSTIKNSINFFLSRAEYEFANNIQKNDRYSLIFLKNINLQANASFPPILEIENPKFEINMNHIGIENEKVILSPSNFKGAI